MKKPRLLYSNLGNLKYGDLDFAATVNQNPLGSTVLILISSSPDWIVPNPKLNMFAFFKHSASEGQPAIELIEPVTALMRSTIHNNTVVLCSDSIALSRVFATAFQCQGNAQKNLLYHSFRECYDSCRGTLPIASLMVPYDYLRVQFALWHLWLRKAPLYWNIVHPFLEDIPSGGTRVNFGRLNQDEVCVAALLQFYDSGTI